MATNIYRTAADVQLPEYWQRLADDGPQMYMWNAGDDSAQWLTADQWKQQELQRQPYKTGWLDDGTYANPKVNGGAPDILSNDQAQKLLYDNDAVRRGYGRITDNGGGFGGMFQDLTSPEMLGLYGGFAAGGGLAGAFGGAEAGATGAFDSGIGLDGLWNYASPELSSAAGASGATGAASASGGGEMWDWLDDLNSLSNGEGSMFQGGSGDFYNGFDQFGDPLGGNDIPLNGQQTQPDLYGPNGSSGYNTFQPELSGPTPSGGNLSNLTWRDIPLLKNLLGSNAGGLNLRSLVGGGKGSSGGGILDSVMNDPLGSAFNATPFLLALNESNRQSKDLNGVLDQINGAGYQKSVLDPFDIQTSTQRGALENSLAARGVSGSSFGNQDLNNFDYTHALARGDLASKAGLASAGLQGQLINQRNTNRNMLLGAGLNASGRLFAPQKDPFNLAALLGG